LEDINFLFTNRIPRGLATRFMGWFSRIENPAVAAHSIAAWRMFADLGLHEAKKTRFTSLHDCFVRELKDDARPVERDPAILASPCDAIVGASGRVEGTRLFQAKGFPYSAGDLLGEAAHTYRDASYVTLRITSSMYHRFHAPHDLKVERVTYFSGDTWNVNPIALKRIERLFCKNERALVECRLADGRPLALVPVAAVLVASIRLHCLNELLHPDYAGPRVIACNAAYAKGEEMGWFQHGSTIIVFAPPGVLLKEESQRIRAGEELLRLNP